MAISTQDRLGIPMSIFKGVNPKVEGNSTLGDVLNEISSSDASKVSIALELRRLKNNTPTEYKKRKEHLSGFCVGEYSTRSKAGCNKYYPLLVFDIDGYDDNTSAIFDLNKLKKLDVVFSAFLSPSGKGLRVLVWSNATKENHVKVYHQAGRLISSHLNIPICKNAQEKEGIKEHIDIGRSSYANLWFYAAVQGDTEFFLNENSKTYSYEPSVIVENESSPSINKSCSYRVEFTSTEKIENVLQQIESSSKDVTSGVENWFKIGCAIASEFGISGSGYFHRTSRFHPDYNFQKCETEYKRCLQKCSKSKITFSSLFYICKEHNIEVDYEQLKEGCRKADSKKEASVLTSSAPSTKEIPFEIFQTPEFPSIDTSPEDGSLLSIEHNSYFWTNTGRKGGATTVKISNFIISPLYHLKSTNGAKRIFSIENEFEEKAVICLPQKTISNNNELSAAIESQGNFIPNWDKKQFNEIKSIIYSKECSATEITSLGYQPGFDIYAFSNGFFDGKTFIKVNEYGIAQVKDKFLYIPATSVINKDSKDAFRSELLFTCNIGTIHFKEWSKLFCKVYEHNQNGIIGICFLLAALFRDIVFQATGFFPILFLVGRPQTGKTSFRSSCQYLFGEPQSALSLGGASSPKGFYRKLTQFKNGLIAFEEFKNRIKDSLIEMMKNVYDGIGYERAQMTNDNKTHATGVYSAVIAGGQQLPVKENALFSRVHLLNFSTTKKKNVDKYEELKSAERNGLGIVILEILNHRKLVRDNFKSVFNTIRLELRESPELSKKSERSIGNIAVLLTVIRILEEQLDLPFKYDEVALLVKEQLLAQSEILERTNEVNRFWQFFELGVDSGEINETSYKFNKQKKVLYVKVNGLYSKYYKHYKDQDIDVLDKESLKRYLIEEPAYIAPKGKRKDHSVYFDGNKARGYAFNIEELNFESEKLSISGSI